MSNNLNLSIILSAVDRLTGPLRNVNDRIDRLHGPVRRLGEEMNRAFHLSGVTNIVGGLKNAGSEAVALTAKLTALAGVGGFLFKREFIDTAAQFEKYNAILETLEGSSEKAKQSMAWISDFATTTPFEFAELTDAFVKLRSYGLDPTSGLMKTLGDTAAAMGKPINQAVEAIADAVTGENERLKEFGITASVKNNQTQYSFVKDGQTFRKTVDNRNKAMIQSTLEAIWNAKYAGSMDKLSRTWDGMMSNLSDQWTRVKLAIMENGAFDFLKGKLDGLLVTVNRMAADGSLARWAKETGDKLTQGLKGAFEGAQRLWAEIKKLAGQVGGFGNLAKIVFGGIAAIMAGPLLLAIVQTLSGFAKLAVFIAANPISLVFVAAAAALLYLWKNFDEFNANFYAMTDAMGEALKTAFNDAVEWVMGIVRKMVNDTIGAVLGIGGAFKRMASFQNPFAGGEKLFPMPAGPALAGATGKPLTTLKPGAQKTEVGGTVNIKLDGPGKVTSMKSDNPNVPIFVSRGLNMPGAY